VAEEAGQRTRIARDWNMTPDEMRAVNAKASDKIKTAFWVGLFVGLFSGCAFILILQWVF